MFFVVDIIHQSGTVNYKINFDKIVGIFPNKIIYVLRGNIVKLSFLNIFQSMHFSVFLNAIYLV